jgi:hypothetical protein
VPQSTTRSLASSAQNAAEAVPLSFFDAARRLCVSMVRAIIGPGGGREPAAGVAPAVSSVPAPATGGMSRGATTKKRNLGSNLLRRVSNLASLPLNIHFNIKIMLAFYYTLHSFAVATTSGLSSTYQQAKRSTSCLRAAAVAVAGPLQSLRRRQQPLQQLLQ